MSELDTIRAEVGGGEKDSNHEDRKATKEVAGALRARDRPSFVFFVPFVVKLSL
jgi:hypothetical protein